MDIRVLNYFLMAAREENITRAAQLLHITQPTLSRQLQQLEQELDAKLFRRSNHNIYLTNKGMLFRRRAQKLVDRAEKARKELAQSEDVLTGEVSIGCGELRSMEDLSEIMDAFRRRHPQVKFHLHSGYNDDIKDGLVFIPLHPTLALSSVLAWEERQTFSSTVSAFIQFAKKYESRMSDDTN